MKILLVLMVIHGASGAGKDIARSRDTEETNSRGECRKGFFEQ